MCKECGVFVFIKVIEWFYSLCCGVGESVRESREGKSEFLRNSTVIQMCVQKGKDNVNLVIMTCCIAHKDNANTVIKMCV